MNEKILNSGLVRTLGNGGLPGAVVFNLADRMTAGIPDVSVTWNGWTSWLEVKYANPEFEVTGVQKLTMARLAAQGLAWFIIYEQEPRRTLIVHPRYIVHLRKRILKVPLLKLPDDFPFVDGFNHQSVVNLLRRVQK